MPKADDALSMLKEDHEQVKKLFKKIEAEKDQESTFNQIKAALESHAAIEEEIFYPTVKKARSEEIKDEVREAYEEHKQVKVLLAAIAEISPDDESYSAKIKVLKDDRRAPRQWKGRAKCFLTRANICAATNSSSWAPKCRRAKMSSRQASNLSQRRLTSARPGRAPRSPRKHKRAEPKSFASVFVVSAFYREPAEVGGREYGRRER